MNDEAHIIVGALIEKDGKYLLVQELKKKCYMQWNLPLGHLDAGETITEGAIRETKEETGYDVKLTGLVDIQNHYGSEYVFIKFTYRGEIIGGDPSEIQTDEINGVEWFSHDELKKMLEAGKLRAGKATLRSIEAYEKGNFLPVDTVTTIERVIEK